MNNRDKIMLAVLNISFVIMFVGCMIIVGLLTEDTTLLVMGFMISFMIVMILYTIVCQYVFKDYIKEFWEREKNAKEKSTKS